jgi:quercetin dioxygenase-like cupin family protein
MGERLKITPTESIEIVLSGDDGLLIEATYQPGAPPPRHFHPEQDEFFEVLDGALRVRVGEAERTHAAGDRFEIPRGVSHTFCCAGAAPARVRWRTVPAGRTEEWFRAINRVQVEGRVGRNGMPGPLAFGVLLTEYRDTFRVAGPDWLLRPVLGALAVIGRRRGYRAGP